ncbi:hypothetical protein ACPD1E_003680 [Vibrio cholerae]
MKKVVKVFLGLAGVFILAIVAVFFFTADMVKSADGFFVAVKNKDMGKAATYLSDDFQASTSQSDLELYLEKNFIHKFKEANWESRSINGNRGSLIGSITTESGGVVPITLSFVKGENGWQIYSIQKPSSGIQEESSPAEMPSEQEQVQLASKSMQIFAESVNEKSMVKFYSHFSNLWQQQSSIEQIDEAFSDFYDIGVDLTVLGNYTPQFKVKPSIDENGALTITGFYPTKPDQVHFEQNYIYEGLGWKLMGFSVRIQ